MADPGRHPDATVMIGPSEPHGEVLDTATRRVWQTVEPITPEAFAQLPLEAGWIRVGIGTGAMDEHWFERSPGAPRDGAMDEIEIAGHRFAYCARPPVDGPSLPAGPEGPRQLKVDKHHVLRFAAGRRVPILRLPDGGDFVHVIEGGPGKPELVLPDGWTLGELALHEDWIVRLPAPATVFFFRNRDSFQGPISIPPRTRPPSRG